MKLLLETERKRICYWHIQNESIQFRYFICKHSAVVAQWSGFQLLYVAIAFSTIAGEYSEFGIVCCRDMCHCIRILSIVCIQKGFELLFYLFNETPWSNALQGLFPNSSSGKGRMNERPNGTHTAIYLIWPTKCDNRRMGVENFNCSIPKHRSCAVEI